MDDIGAIQLAVKVDYKQLTGLIKTTDQTKRAVSVLAKDFARTGNLSKYMTGINHIDAANRKLGNSSSMTRTQIMRFGKKVEQQTRFTDSLTAATRRLNAAQITSNKAMGNTRNKMNGSNMAIQQLGYQFGDFAVQVQGGTSAFVAFSQQGSQLAGILPMIAGPLGLSMGAAVGLSAALGILIPIGSAIGRMFMETSGAGKSLKDTVGDLSSSFDTYIDSVSKANTSTEDLLKTYGRITPEILELEERLQALQLRQVALDAQATAKAISNFNFGGALMGGELADIKATFDTTIDGARMLEAAILAVGQAEGPEDTLLAIQALSAEALRASGGIDKLTAEQIKFLQQVTASEQEFQRLVNIIGIAEKSISSSSDQVDKLQARLEQLGKMRSWTRSMSKGYKVLQDSAKEARKINKELRDSTSLQLRKNQLVDAELKYGKDSNVYKNELVKLEKFQLEVEQKITKEKYLALGVDEASIDLMHLQQTEALKLLQIRRDIANTPLTYSMMEGSDAAQRLGKYGGRGTTSDKDPTMGGVSIYKEPEQTQEQKDAEALGKYIDQLKHQKSVTTELVGIFGSERDIKQKILDVQNKYKDVIDDNQVKEITRVLQLTDAETKRHDALEKAKQEQEALGASIEASMEKAFMSMVDGTTSVKDAFKSMASEIIKELYRVLVVKKMVAAISSVLPFADGGVISSGSQVQAYANGGVVSSPTTFGMSGGKTGLMGEAGPEAIMPLKRGANGKLGVQMEGGGATTVVQNFNFSANGDDSVKRIIAQAAPKIAEMTKSQIVNDRKRGGSMKAAFG